MLFLAELKEPETVIILPGEPVLEERDILSAADTGDNGNEVMDSIAKIKITGNARNALKGFENIFPLIQLLLNGVYIYLNLWR
jgi:hypothetical protein